MTFKIFFAKLDYASKRSEFYDNSITPEKKRKKLLARKGIGVIYRPPNG